jgi:cytidylate kinase
MIFFRAGLHQCQKASLESFPEEKNIRMSLPKIIAIDGPAASGKSTLALRVAQHLNYLFFDTGVMYRAITWSVMQQSIQVEDEAAVTRLAEQTHIDVRPPSVKDGRTSDVLVDGNDVTWAIRDPQVDAKVSIVAAYPGVRQALTQQQRRVGQRGQVVMVGRDIGTVVLPEADLKIYLDASAEQRAQRRYEELISRRQTASYKDILESMNQRDHIDANRKVAPLRPAEDALRLDSDLLDADQVLTVVLGWIQAWERKP